LAQHILICKNNGKNRLKNGKSVPPSEILVTSTSESKNVEKNKSLGQVFHQKEGMEKGKSISMKSLRRNFGRISFYSKGNNNKIEEKKNKENHSSHGRA